MESGSGDVTYSQVFGSMGGWIIGLLLSLLIILGLVFAIWMIIDSIRRGKEKYPKGNKKGFWIGFLILSFLILGYLPYLEFIPPLIYFYKVKKTPKEPTATKEA